MPAYAYLLIPPQESLSPVARKRLAAIKEFSDLGSGFRVAALDLEIRGAGNLLGGEQSGHIDAVGFEMYMKLLEETIRELQGEELEDDTRVDGQPARRPEDRPRIHPGHEPAADGLPQGRRGPRTEQELTTVLEELRDRYGSPPDSVLNLAEYGRIRIKADRLDVDTIDREGRLVVIKFRPNARLDRCAAGESRQRLAGGHAGAAGFAQARPGGTARSEARWPPRRRPQAREGKAGAKPNPGELVDGASNCRRGEARVYERRVLRKPDIDPRAEGGMFSRLMGLLEALSVQ